MQVPHSMQKPCSCSERSTITLRTLLRSQHTCRPLQVRSSYNRACRSRLSHFSNGGCVTARERQSLASHCRHSTDAELRQHGPMANGAGEGAILTLLPFLLGCGPALADAEAKYNPTQGSESVKTIAGVFYAGLLAVFAFRLLTRRARKFKEERIASAPAEQQAAESAAAKEAEKVVTPLRALWSAIRLGVFAYLLFRLSSGVDGYFEGQALPGQLTARNITITLRTVVRGLSYLLTFLFAANTVGLAALTVQLVINPKAGTEPTIVKATEVAEDITQGGPDRT